MATKNKKTAAKAAESGAAKFVDAFLIDLNGVERGKRLPAKDAGKIEKSALRFPRSLIGVDVWGNDVFDNGLVVDTGDGDGLCPLVPPGIKTAPWAKTPTLQAQVMMAEANGDPFAADPRQLLINARDRAKAMGFTPVAAVELEFYLLTNEFDELGRPLPPKGANGKRVREGRVYAMAELDAYGAFLGDLYAACDAQGLPLDAAVIEAGPSQFEVNLKHQPDIVAAADQAVWLRRAIRGVAGKHGLAASFMAKPFGDLPGNGMHAHMSFLTARGANAFETGKTLEQAVAGLIATMQEGMIFFAPHLNSWRRFQAGTHAPTRASWGRENRTASIRIPADGGANTRFEHRVAGADANPYLMLAAILFGALYGVDKKLTPPPALTGNVYTSSAPRLDIGWVAALEAFEGGGALKSAFGPLFAQVYVALKRQEMRAADRRVTDFEYDSYLFAF